ncbi:MAG: CBS domain-containing protein [Archaeoglobaceae archaeon]
MKTGRDIRYGNIMEVATSEVVTVPPTSTIMSALKTMVAYRFRRIPVADAGSKRFLGLLVAMDLIDFFGGGRKHGIVLKHKGNLIIAVNEEVEEIMEKEVVTVDISESWMDALEVMLSKDVSYCPVLDKERVAGIITERDMLELLTAKKPVLKKPYVFDGMTTDVASIMTKSVITIEPAATIGNAMKTMIDKKIRRLPVITDGVFVGLITDRDILRYFGGEAFKMILTGNVNEILEKPISVMLSKEFLVHKEPLIISPAATASEVAEKMVAQGHGAALILSDGSLEGIITEKDLMQLVRL